MKKTIVLKSLVAQLDRQILLVALASKQVEFTHFKQTVEDEQNSQLGIT